MSEPKILSWGTDAFVEYLQQPGNEADAWRVVEALAPKLAGPWERSGLIRKRPMYALCAAFRAYIDDVQEDVDAVKAADGWRLVR